MYKNVRGMSKFLNEAGMYSLIMKSKMKKAKDVQEWIYGVVLPELRKYGKIKLGSENKKYIDGLNEKLGDLRKKLNEKNNEIDVLKHNMKNQHFPQGGMVYILRNISDKIILNTNEILYLKFGKTMKMKNRKSNYDTSNVNRTQILKSVLVNDPLVIERCVQYKLRPFQIKDKKEYYECTYNQIIDVVFNCVKLYDEVEIDKKPNDDVPVDIKKDLKRVAGDEKYLIKFISDDEFEALFENNNEIDNDNENDNTCDSESDDDLDSDHMGEQQGGHKSKYNDSYLYEYLKYKHKYLLFKFETSDDDIDFSLLN